MIVNNVKPYKISAFYLDRKKSFVPKKRFVLVKELVSTKEEFYLHALAVCICFTHEFELSQIYGYSFYLKGKRPGFGLLFLI